MTDLQMWSLLVGFFLPLAIAIIQQPQWSNAVRATLTFAVCAVAGLVTAYLNGDLAGRAIISTILLVLVTALTTFRNLWRPTNVTPTLERLTSPGSTVPEMNR